MREIEGILLFPDNKRGKRIFRERGRKMTLKDQLMAKMTIKEGEKCLLISNFQLDLLSVEGEADLDQSIGITNHLYKFLYKRDHLFNIKLLLVKVIIPESKISLNMNSKLGQIGRKDLIVFLLITIRD